MLKSRAAASLQARPYENFPHGIQNQVQADNHDRKTGRVFSMTTRSRSHQSIQAPPPRDSLISELRVSGLDGASSRKITRSLFRGRVPVDPCRSASPIQIRERLTATGLENLQCLEGVEAHQGGGLIAVDGNSQAAQAGASGEWIGVLHSSSRNIIVGVKQTTGASDGASVGSS